MPAYQPDPEKLTAFEELGGGSAETLLANPPRPHVSRRLGRNARGRLILADEDRDAYRNPQAAEYSEKEMETYHEIAQRRNAEIKAQRRAHLAETAMGDTPSKQASPEQLAMQHSEAVDGWSEENDDTTDLTGPVDYRYWKRPDER